MSKSGKIFFAFSLLAFLILGSARLIYGGWHPSFWAPFGLMILCFAGGGIIDHRALREIFALRTTKHGMNMGALILTAIVGLVCVNYLATRFDRKFDWTSDHFNSLSEQSVKATEGLKAPVELVILYRKDANGGSDAVDRQAHTLVDMYRHVNNKVTLSVYDGLQRPDLAQKFEFQYGPYVAYAVQGERKLKVEPLSEEGITRALVKLGRDKKKIMYFTRGHGEALLDDKEPTGLSSLKDDLSVTYEVKPLALFETGDKVPDDADVLAIIGPKQQFLEAEFQAVREYLRRGGKLLLAIDPGQKHNMAQLARTMGVEFNNNFVLDLRSRALQGSPTLILGSEFSHDNDITKAFKATGNEFTLFELASSLKKAGEAPASWQFDNLVQTDKSTATVNEMKEKVEYHPNGPHTIALAVKGELPVGAGAAPGAKAAPFQAVVFGDSDFMENRLLQNNLNRDLAENSFAWLTDDHDMITIRPKQPKGTRLNLPSGSFYALVLSLLLVSVVLFGSGVTFWWRRRTA